MYELYNKMIMCRMMTIKIDSSSICFLKKTLSSRISQTFIILLLLLLGSFSFVFHNRINDYKLNSNNNNNNNNDTNNNDNNDNNNNNNYNNKNKNNHVYLFTSAFLIGAVNHHNHHYHNNNPQPLFIVVPRKQIPTPHYPYNQALFLVQHQEQQQQQRRKPTQELYKRKDTISSTEDEPNDVNVVDDESLLLDDRIENHNNGDAAIDNTATTDSRSDTMWENKNSELLEVDETNNFWNDYYINNNNNNNDIVDDDAWVPDSIKAKRQRTQRVQNMLYPERSSNNNARTENNVDNKVNTIISDEDITSTSNTQYEQMKDLYSNSRKSPYTDEEDDIIMRMGGKTSYNNNSNNSNNSNRKREEGYLGDCTLQEIATDYSVPVSYLADVLCTWGVPIPIDIKYTRLGDMVTGEQAFAIVEAVNTIDVATLQDRYSNMNLVQLCYEYDITIQNAFEMCIREGYNLPFGVQTCLRIEQEEELVRVLGESTVSSVNEDDDEFE